MFAQSPTIVVQDGVVEEKISLRLEVVRRKRRRKFLEMTGEEFFPSLERIAIFDELGVFFEGLARCVVEKEVLLEVDGEGIAVSEAGGGEGDVREDYDGGEQGDEHKFARER